MENNLCTFISLCIGCRIFSFTLSVYSSVLQLNSGVKEELISISETGLSREELVFCVMWSHIIVALRVCCRSVWVCGPIRHSWCTLDTNGNNVFLSHYFLITETVFWLCLRCKFISASHSFSLKYKTSLLCKVNGSIKNLFIKSDDSCACDVSLCILLEPVLCPFVLCSGGVTDDEWSSLVLLTCLYRCQW